MSAVVEISPHFSLKKKYKDLVIPNSWSNSSTTHPEEDVAGGVKASGINLSGARRAVSDDPARESTYCTLGDLPGEEYE